MKRFEVQLDTKQRFSHNSWKNSGNFCYNYKNQGTYMAKQSLYFKNQKVRIWINCLTLCLGFSIPFMYVAEFYPAELRSILGWFF